MGKNAARAKRTTIKNSDPTLDYLAMFDARSMLLTNLVGLGWRMALMVLIPIFIGVQLDNKFDSTPSLTLAAFFIAIFGAGIMIYKTFIELSAQAAQDDKKLKRKSTVRRTKNV